MASAEDPQYVFGEVGARPPPGLRATMHAGTATPAEIVKIARDIWARIGGSGVARDDNAGNDKLLEELQKEFKDFNTSFPVVLRWMVQMRAFSEPALHKYLLKHADAKLDSREDFLDLQSEYLVLLRAEKMPRGIDRAQDLARYREAVKKALRADDKEFQASVRWAEASFDARQCEIDNARREEIYRVLTAARPSAAAPK